MKEVELTNGEIIENVTRIADCRLHSEIQNIHTPGSGYRPVLIDDIKAIRPTGDSYE